MVTTPDPTGKRALFGAPVGGSPNPPARGRPSEVRGRHALFSSAVGGDKDVTPTTKERIILECSSCGAFSGVNFLDFVALHMPLWFWHPGKGFTRLMRCPACRRRTWISASLKLSSH